MAGGCESFVPRNSCDVQCCAVYFANMSIAVKPSSCDFSRGLRLASATRSFPYVHDDDLQRYKPSTPVVFIHSVTVLQLASWALLRGKDERQDCPRDDSHHQMAPCALALVNVETQATTASG